MRPANSSNSWVEPPAAAGSGRERVEQGGRRGGGQHGAVVHTGFEFGQQRPYRGIVAEAGARALQTGSKQVVEMIAKPEFYA